jgi:uncharacterized membrane protein
MEHLYMERMYIGMYIWLPLLTDIFLMHTIYRLINQFVVGLSVIQFAYKEHYDCTG